ncbi:uncharacterized protein BDR25DRAFT_298927 [Lindgomyces ingoldianus]|uniref:Uncharacterized protein n=1 Tax=Lindgomyces ingoldianus TaxID=673940 RepID=A0ACB6Q8H6_9PLEO|nr:uncharacterized protein BDR25DRAFT_298927 [Lindgomyces ingoldianus]KAF2462835.1 hypothetical protein BDR25DRAFT_298927 [Lindgomyces ingoldianus]
MKYTTAILALAAAVSAQGISDIPSCALACVATGVQGVGCSITDFKCACGKADQLTPAITPCVQSACSAADEAKVITVLGGICAAAGVPINVSTPPASSAAPATSAQVVESSAPVSSAPVATTSAIDTYPTASADSCAVVTITTTVTLGKPKHSSIPAPTAPYPTGPAPYPSSPTGTGSSYVAPTGTGSYTSPPLFTGAASAIKVPAGVAGLMGLVAYLL